MEAALLVFVAFIADLRLRDNPRGSMRHQLRNLAKKMETRAARRNPPDALSAVARHPGIRLKAVRGERKRA